MRKSPETWSKMYSKVFSVVFFAVMLLQLLGPGLSLSTISDNFLWRMALVKGFNSIRLLVGDRVFNNGLVGEDGWLFYSGDFSINDYQKTAPLGKNRIKELTEVLGLLDERTSQYGGTLLVVIPPDKNTIYPQYMPDQIRVIGKTSRLDQLMDYLQKNTNINVLDLRPVFLDASQSSQIYYKSDAHWNCLGAYYASNEIISEVGRLHPEIQPRPLADFQIGSTIDTSLDISWTMGLGLQENAVTLTPKFVTGSVSHTSYENNEFIKVAVNSLQNLPSAMILHDSFYNECLNQILEPQFGEIISMHFADALSSDYLKLIDTEKPDVVIVEFAERHIEYFSKLITPVAK